MPKVFSFSYIPYTLINSQTNKTVGEIFRPMITIRLSIRHGSITPAFDALADSGSDRNLLPGRWGDILGINFKKIRPRVIRGIGGININVYPAKVNIWLVGEKYSTEADFSYEQKDPLLGRKGFFDLFENVCFKEKERFTVISLK